MNFHARILDYSTSTGTGNFTPASTPDPGFMDFTALETPIGNQRIPIQYTIEAVDGSGVPTGQWETGSGYYIENMGEIERTNPKENSAGTTAALNFSAGTKKVFITPHNQFFEQATLGFQYAMARGFALP